MGWPFFRAIWHGICMPGVVSTQRLALSLSKGRRERLSIGGDSRLKAWENRAWGTAPGRLGDSTGRVAGITKGASAL